MPKEHLFNEIEKEIQRNTKGIQRLTELKEEESKRIKRARDYEKHKWERFKQIIKGKKYFKFEHFDKIGVKYDILIHLSCKNAGKTTELYREITRVLKRGEKFLYGRVYPNEMELARHQFETDELSPVMMLSKGGGAYYFYKKEDIDAWKMARADAEIDPIAIYANPRITDLEKVGIKPVGLGYTFYKSNSLPGSGYEGYTTVFFDEILSYNPRNMINQNVLNAWQASVSTILRNKAKIRILMMGNLHNVSSHPILNFYGVSVDDDLRIIRRGDDDCVILYVNSGDLYEGSFKNQGGVAKHGDLEQQAFLMMNKQIKPTPNILNERIFEDMEFDVALAFYSIPDPYYVEVRKLFDEDTGKMVFCLRCRILRMTTMAKGPIQTDDPNVFNRFHNVRRRITIEQPYNYINRLYNGGNLKFDSMESINNFSVVYLKNKHLIYQRGK